MVYLILLVETAQTAVSSLDVYAGLASSNFGSPTDLDNIRQHWLTVPVFGAISESFQKLLFNVLRVLIYELTAGGIGQFFFAYRIWGLTIPGERGTPILVAIVGSFGVVIINDAIDFFFNSLDWLHLVPVLPLELPFLKLGRFPSS